jgi:cell division protein ZapE
VFRLDARTDFRLEKLARGKAYLTPIGPNTHAAMLSIWEAANEGVRAEPVVLKLKGRTLAPLRAGGRNAWFSFDQLCREPRGATDFLAVANRFDVVFLEGVPAMTAAMRNEAKRFILLIDTLYDASVRIIVSAEKPADQLYPVRSGTEAFEFDRTVSRLIEMQSQDYLGRTAMHAERKPVSAGP